MYNPEQLDELFFLLICCRPEDIRVPFEEFGPVKDVYLPRNFHTR